MNKNVLLSCNNTVLRAGLLAEGAKVVREKMIPYQWETLHDQLPNAEPSHAIRNLRIAAAEESGEYQGMVFQDSDVAKWLEAVAYCLATHPDPQWEQKADSVIDLVDRAQQPDGYLNSYYTIVEPEKRWTNLAENHELYCAGHFIEAAVAYYEATGKDQLLQVVCKLVDHIDSIFGYEPSKLQGYPGHEEIELALMRLYQVTKNERHLRLAQYFVEQRVKNLTILRSKPVKGEPMSLGIGVVGPIVIANPMFHSACKKPRRVTPSGRCICLPLRLIWRARLVIKGFLKSARFFGTTL